ncbi:MAG: nucleotide-binding protein [Chloroflexi bacterium]|nr:nucleotide-binding protein [Chloroflexota bacterium]
MARKSQPLSPIQVQPSLPPEQAIQLLQIQVDKGKQLLANRPITSASEKTWETVTNDVLIQAFGANSPNVSSVMDADGGKFYLMTGSEKDWEIDRAEDMETRLEVINGLIELLQNTIQIEKERKSPNAFMPNTLAQLGNRVFLVHGKNEEAIQTTARFLEKLDLQATILREQPNEGRTIIEKFEDYSDVAYAVVLLVGDDRGGAKDAAYEVQMPQARQNVILELGFFLGKLGRKRVCALYQEGVEVPSDYDGVAFVPFDNGSAWKWALARELKAAGLEIDMNRAV